MIDFTRYEGELFSTLAEMYGITYSEAVRQYAMYKAKQCL